MMDGKILCYFIRNSSVPQQVQVIIRYVFYWLFFQPVFSKAANGAPRTMFKNNCGLFSAVLFYNLQLLLIRNFYPIHRAKLPQNRYSRQLRINR